ncbi:MAG: hypothetical protein ACE5I3_10455 [Phycisphaerae bacterium]
MRADWRFELAERLINAADTAGAWGYRADSAGSAEPTALAALALATMKLAPEHVAGALQWLAHLQRSDGAVPISAEAPSPHWPTALALLAWLRATPRHDQTFAAQAERATNWLLRARGRRIRPDPVAYDHDTALVGWPWAAGTHSWLEPTAYAILALRVAEKADHPRVREGVRLILDRALPDGGWNYGNPRVLEHVLRPFPATTGVALAALAGESRDERVNVALEYLAKELRRLRAPLSLAWGLIGMRAWNAQPFEAQARLDDCARRVLDRPATPHYDALLLLAGGNACPLIDAPEARADE